MNNLIITFGLAWHVVVRNWIVYRKDFLANISPTLADPALIMISLGMGLSPFIQEIGGYSYAQYLAPGMIATTALFTSFFECSYGFYVRMTYESVFKAMLTTPIGVNEVILGEFLWVFVRASIMALGVTLVLLVMGLVPNPWAILVCPLIGGFLSLPCAAIGLLAAAFVRNINQFQTVYSFLIAPIYFLSAVFFPLDGRPILSTIVQISPFYHGVRLLQSTVWNEFRFLESLMHFAALIGFTLIFGFFAFRLLTRKLTV
ncbi:MAG: ABC transporter permease [Verrucomicrobiota bacterium]